MSEEEKTKLEAYADGQTMRKRQSPKRKKLNATASGRKRKTTTTKKQTQPEPARIVEPELAPIEEQHNVIFKPNAGPQTDFLAAGEREVLYGGSAGGGKSYAMLADPLRFMGHPAFSGLLLRHTTEELRELIFKSQEMYPKIWPGIKWSERKMQWTAPSGARLWMSYLDKEDDVLRYQGLAFSWIGHHWVKKMFIDPAPYGKAFNATDIETNEVLSYPAGHAKAGKPLFKRRFIPARLSDNPYLAEQGDYEAMLLSLPEQQRRQLLDGDWDIKEGAAFTEFDRNIHVIEPFNIPSNWVKFRACDYGYGSKSGVIWFAVAPNEQLYVYRELYVSKVLAADLADMVLDLEAEDGNIKYGVLDSSLWHKRGDTGPSLAEQMIQRGCRWRPSDRSKGSRVAGKNEIHRRLQVDEFTEEPRMVFFNTCTNIVAQLPALPLDKRNPEDIDTTSEDHLYDALRYGIMSRPRFSIFDYDPNGMSSGGMRVADATFGY
jgi:hypothetical protein